MTPLSLSLYAAGTRLLEPLAPALLKRRAARGKEDPERLAERLGHAGRARPPGRLIWLHGASVGESLSLLPLIEALQTARPDAALLVTSGTRTSAELLAKRLPPEAIHQYAPVDAPAALARFLGHWRPDLLVLAESELWPNLLMAARARGVRTALVSARITEASARGWSRAPGAARALMSGFDLFLPQDDASAARAAALGARDGGRLNLKLLGAPLPADPQRLAVLSGAAAGRPVLLAASTHPGEEEMALRAFAQARGALLVIVPRHPDRGEAVALLTAAGGSVARQSAGQAFGGTEVFVADVLGELGLWYRLAAGAFIGGSLVAGPGGHNPVEAAQLGCPIASGPLVENWASVYAPLVAAEACRVTADAGELAAAFADFAAGSPAVRQGAERAAALFSGEAEALREAVAALTALVPA
ncbi:MAG TPA: glycosyltransferase N-terminal domain-containing protein [Phenylobacterium sp.]|nr:glycosyltransferase N-terminal domain-containing protein [Phenylobacterium sp.]